MIQRLLLVKMLNLFLDWTTNELLENIYEYYLLQYEFKLL